MRHNEIYGEICITGSARGLIRNRREILNEVERGKKGKRKQ
jgi:hypothetical protein